MWPGQFSSTASAVVDNIPFVATMIPVIKSMAPTFGGAENLVPLWWSLALGACLGGNGSLVGASANLIIAGFAERSGHRIRFLPFMLMAFPLMLLSIVICSLYISLRYLWPLRQDEHSPAAARSKKRRCKQRLFNGCENCKP